MHSTLQRISNTFALATTVLLTLILAISTTTFLLPADLASNPASLRINHLNVVMGRSNNYYARDRKEREFAFAKFDLRADLTPLFNWNTKQVFVYLVADYSTPQYKPDNKVVLWDRIVRTPRQARLNVQDGKQKYEFKDIGGSFRNTSATFSLHYQVQPHVGLLTSGEVVRTEPVAFPAVRRRSQ
ncbi:hypothetical protein JCM10207_000823 [Rhodosporidiobolus poonsookiae]